MANPKIEVDGLKVLEEYLLYKGENIVVKDMCVLFKPLVEMGLLVYELNVNSTTKTRMRFELEKFFGRRNMLSGIGCSYVKVPQSLFDRVKKINDEFRSIKQ